MSEIAQTMIKKGALFLLTGGEYSYYQVLTVCKATQDIDVITLRDEYLEVHPQQRENYHFNEFEFARWLIANKGLAEELNYLEWHLGSYACVEFSVQQSESALRQLSGVLSLA